MKTGDFKSIYKHGRAVALLGLLYFGVYLLARNNGDIVHIENRGSETGRTIRAQPPQWIEIQIGIAEDTGSAPLAFWARLAKAKTLILNTLFWPLRKLETIYRNVLHPAGRSLYSSASSSRASPYEGAGPNVAWASCPCPRRAGRRGWADRLSPSAAEVARAARAYGTVRDSVVHPRCMGKMPMLHASAA